MPKKIKALVTGTSGLLGGAICDSLLERGNVELIKLSRSECDLLNADEVDDFFKGVSPDWVFHCAAKVGGIAANKNYPVDFLIQNMTIQNNVFQSAYNCGVKRLIFFASNAVYPENIERPIKETDILTGKPEATVRPYALAKLAGIELCDAFNKQHNTSYLSLIPVNLYGPKDNFHPVNSHVLPALIRKFHEAKVNNLPEVSVWGTGNQRREFMCSLDLARIACEVMELDETQFTSIVQSSPPMLNIGTGTDINVRELAKLVSDVVAYSGNVVFDTSKPEGIQKKQTSIEKMDSYGFQAKIGLEDGIRATYNYYLNSLDA